jgi:branched-chain amino acid transport system substrate-binding protein
VPVCFIKHLQDFVADSNVIAVLYGRYSLVVVEAILDIHQLKLPLLDLWDVADFAIARDFRDEFYFRLSLWDTWAMQAMIFCAEQHGHVQARFF